MSRSSLAADDFRVGMFLTTTQGPTTDGVEDGSWQGDVLELIAVDLPFVVVKTRSVAGLEDDNVSLDTREFSFKELSSAYVAAMLETAS